MTLVRPRRILVIANPAAGSRRREDAGEAAARAAAKGGAEVELARTTQPGDGVRLAEAASQAEFDLVVAAGGDGTVNEAANGLAGRGPALGVAPAGTMNLLARVLRVPLDPAAAVASLVEGYRPLTLMPGSAGGRVFLLMAGCGFDAWVLRELLRGVQGKIGFTHYVRGALRGLRSFPFPRLTIDYERGIAEAHTVVVGRAPLYGGFLRPTPGAALGVDALELCAIAGGPLRLAALLPRLFSGAHARRSGVTLVPVRRVTITAGIADVPYQVDGELAGVLPLAIELSERRLVLATPGGFP